MFSYYAGAYEDWERERDRRELKAKEYADRAAFFEAVYPTVKTRDELGRFLPRPGAPPKKKLSPKSASRRAQARALWQHHAARGLPGRCLHCSRVTIAPAAKGLCKSCYSTSSGFWKRAYRRRIAYVQKWREAHPEKCREYDRRYSRKVGAKAKRNSRQRRRRAARRRERLQALRRRLHEERRA